MALDPVVIDNFQKGVAQSAALGFQEMLGIDIDSAPGIAMLNHITSAATGATLTGEIKFFARDPDSGNSYFATSDGKAYQLSFPTAATCTYTEITPSGVPSLATTTGLVIYKGYLFQFGHSGGVGSNHISRYYKIATSTWGTPVWHNGSVYFPSVAPYDYHHHTHIGSDDVLYITGGRYLLSISEPSGTTFDPTDAAKCDAKITASSNALDLPPKHNIQSIVETSGYLYLIVNNDYADGTGIYPWDMVSASYELPIKSGKRKLYAATIQDGYIYIIGEEGTLYVSNGVSLQPAAKIPEEFTKTSAAYYYLRNPFYVNSTALCSFAGKIYLGAWFSRRCYLWTYTPSSGVLNMESIVTGQSETAYATRIYSIFPHDSAHFLIGKTVGTTSGVDFAVLDTKPSTYTYSYMISPIYRVGSNLVKRPFSSCEIVLAKPLLSGEGIKVETRSAINGSWRTVATLETTGAQNYQVPYAASHVLLQVKISLKADATTGAVGSTPELLAVIFS